MTVYDDDAKSRNYILNLIHGKIPSYALWEPFSIAELDNDINAEWWLSFTLNESILVREISKYWYKYYSLKDLSD